MRTDLYNRERDLHERLNGFLIRELKVPDSDYYSNLTGESLLSLKSVLAEINNIFTLRLALKFIDWLAFRFKLDAGTAQRIKDSLLEINPSANGFDVYVPSPIRAIAEVKCNVPVNGGERYGAQQRKGIERDVTALLEGKSKARCDVSGCLKFLVLLDHPKIRAATEHLQWISNICKGRLVMASDTTELDRHDVVYVVYVGPQKIP